MKATTPNEVQPVEVNYRSIFEHAVEGIFQSTPDGRFIAVNPALARIMGFASPAEMLALRRDIAKEGYVRPEDREEFKRLLAAHGSVSGFEYEGYRKDGDRCWLSESARAVHDETGRLVCYEGTVEDITARKQAEVMLSARERRLRAIFESEPECVKLLAADGTLLEMNPAGLRMIEADSFQQVAQQCVYPLVAVEHRAAFQALNESVFAGGSGSLEFQIDGLKGGHRWLETHASPLRDASGQVTAQLSITRDITERRQAESALAATAELFERTSAMAKVGGWELDLRTLKLFWTLETCRIHEVDPPVAPALDQAIQFYAPEVRPVIQAAVQAGIDHGTPWDLELPLITAKGRCIWVRAQGSAVKENGKAVKLHGAFQDITERRRAKQRIAAFAKLGRQLNATYQADEAARIILGVADELLGYDCCTLALYDATTDLCNSILTVDILNGQRQEVLPIYVDAPPSPRMRHAIAHGAELLLREEPLAFASSEIPFGDTTRPSASLMIAPLRDGVHVIGVLSIQSYTLHAYSEEDLDTLQALADHCGGALARIKTRAELEQEQELLRGSEEKFQNLFESTPDAIIVATREGVIHTINRQAEQLFGYTREELVGQAIEMLMPARLRSGHVALRGGYVANPHIRPMGEGRDLWARRKDGTEFPADISLSPMTTPEGMMVISTIRDISKRKQAEEQVRQAEAKYRSIFENAVEGIIQTTLDGRFITANPTMARLLGYDSAEALLAAGLVLGRDVYANPDDRTAMVRILNEGGQHAGFQCQFKRRGGQLIWVSITGRMVRDAQGTPLFYEGTCEDTTERRQLEDQLRESQKMEAIGQLAGGIAHDFNNILGAIMGNTELVKSMPAGSREAGECLDAIHSASRRAADLVKQILAFSRRQEQKRQPLQLHLIVREALKLLRASMPAAIEFRTSVAITPTVLADPTQIHSVTMNLCTNAWHAMQERPGTLTVELAETEVNEAFARVNPDLRPGRYVRLTITDTGCGMSAETLEHIFEPFFTTKPVGEGTGLGLAVVHGIMKNHDGGIVVRSQPGRGTTFALYFPVFEAEVVEAPAAPQPIPHGTGERILFVDDEEAMARMGSAALGRLNYRVTARTSPVEALSLFTEQPAQYDLVVTDLNMPGLSGIEFARKLLAIRPDVRIILATGFSATITADVARELGFCALLPKPYALRVLGEAVNRALTETALTKLP